MLWIQFSGGLVATVATDKFMLWIPLNIYPWIIGELLLIIVILSWAGDQSGGPNQERNEYKREGLNQPL